MSPPRSSCRSRHRPAATARRRSRLSAGRPSASSAMALASAVRVWPTRAVPEIVGSPVAASFTGRDVERDGVGSALRRAVAHLEGEAGVGRAVGVRRRRVDQIAEIRSRHRVVRRHRRSGQLERPLARSGERHHPHARKRVTRVRVRKGKVPRLEAVGRVLVHRRRQVRRRRRRVRHSLRVRRIGGAGAAPRRARRGR